jgi:hypothetical protein
MKSIRKRSFFDLETLSPNLWDLALLAGTVQGRREQRRCPRSSGPGSALELRPRIALSSAAGEKSIAELDAAKQHRTIHLLFKPDILTCYQHP